MTILAGIAGLGAEQGVEVFFRVTIRSGNTGGRAEQFVALVEVIWSAVAHEGKIGRVIKLLDIFFNSCDEMIPLKKTEKEGYMKKSAASILTLASLLLVCCEQASVCPDTISANPDSESSSIMWGEKAAKVSAHISSVAAECIPYKRQLKKDSEKQVIASYGIPITTKFEYEIVDKKWFENATVYSDLHATILFEVYSKSGVVLGSEKARVKIVSGGTEGSASATISLAPEEVKRIDRISAKWLYGRD